MNEELQESQNLNTALSNLQTFSDSLFKRAKSLSKFLPYAEELNNEGMILLKDGSLGACFKVDLLEHEAMNSKEIVKAVEGLKSWFSLPENCVLQVIHEQFPLSSHDPLWEKIKNEMSEGHPIGKMLTLERLNRFRYSENLRNHPFKRETLVAIRFFPEGQKEIKEDSILVEESKNYLRAIREFESILKTFENSSKINLERLKAEELLSFLRRKFNPKLFYKRSFAPMTPNAPLSDQIFYNSPRLDFKGIEREGVKTRTITLKTAPAYRYQGAMAEFLKLEFPFGLSLNLSFPTKKKAESFFNFKEVLLEKSVSERGKRQLADIRKVQKSLAHDDRVLHLTLTVTIEGESEEELEERERKVTNIFTEDLEAEVITENDIGLGLYLSSLPLNYTPRFDHSSARFIRILKSDATCFLPIFDSFRGLKEAKTLFLSREKNLVKFSLKEDPISNHTVVCADTGSGKSAFIIDALIGEKGSLKKGEKEPLVFVIDKKSSYKMMAPFFDGDMTIFDPRSEMPFSPFRGEFDEQKVAFLVSFFKAAITLTSPSFEFESEHIAALTKALKLSYVKKSRQSGLSYQDGELSLENEENSEIEVTMDDFIGELSSLTALSDFEKLEFQIDKLLTKLKPFYGDGPYAKYLCGSEKKRSKNCLLYVYDLDALTDKILQQLMTMAVIEEIRQTIKLPEHKGRGGFVVLEELGMLGRDNKEASNFVIDAAETYRKLGYWLISLTPRPQNYFKLEVGRAMMSVATHFIFLQLMEDSVEYIKNHSNILDEATAEIAASLRTKEDEYAEVLYIHKTKGVQGAFRSHQMPLGKWLRPTNAKDEQIAEEALNRFAGDHLKAIEHLSNHNTGEEL